MTDAPPEPDAGDEQARRRVLADIAHLRAVVTDAPVVHVGQDHEYVPDGPHASDGHPNATEGER